MKFEPVSFFVVNQERMDLFVELTMGSVHTLKHFEQRCGNDSYELTEFHECGFITILMYRQKRLQF